MAGKAAELRGQARVSDYLSVGLLSRLVPPSLVDEALTAHNRHSKRQRDLPAHAVAYYVMALSLYRGVNTEEVLRVVTEGMDYLGDAAIRRKVGKSAISASRTRLGAEVMHYIAEHALTPLAQPQTVGAFYRGLRVVSMDGTTLEVADETSNREAFGVPGTQQGQTGYPQIRCVGLLENGTHALFGVALGGYKDSEVSLAHQAIQNLKPGMLCLADRGFSGYPLWQAASQTGAQLLWRIPKNRKLPVLKRFKDGSYLSQISPAPATLKKMSDKTAPAITVRVIDYRLPGVADAEPVYRLITTLLDAEQYLADGLAALYHVRWSIETTFAEIKTTLKGADIVLRSKTPELVRQEFWGLLLAHHVVRKLMLEAALSRQRTPDVLSFKHSLTLIRRKLPASGAISPRALPEVVVSVD
ncbi:MAG: IS4 family transposase [Nitrosomonadaceae bacterium]|nr:IS4 family transposase [Nitrosomonadaceae bacterium]